MNPNLLFVLNMVLTFGVPLVLITRANGPRPRKPDDRRPRTPTPPPPFDGEPTRPALPACLIPSVQPVVARQANEKVLEPA
jgi:hypothetical protein